MQKESFAMKLVAVPAALLLFASTASALDMSPDGSSNPCTMENSNKQPSLTAICDANNNLVGTLIEERVLKHYFKTGLSQKLKPYLLLFDRKKGLYNGAVLFYTTGNCTRQAYIFDCIESEEETCISNAPDLAVVLNGSSVWAELPNTDATTITTNSFKYGNPATCVTNTPGSIPGVPAISLGELRAPAPFNSP
jgi:hypothetical protein